MVEIYIPYVQNGRWLREPNLGNPWDTGEYDQSSTVTGVHITRPEEGHYEMHELDANVGDAVYVAWCRFSERTFVGTTKGQLGFLGVCHSEEEAQQLANSAYTKYENAVARVESVHVDRFEVTL